MKHYLFYLAIIFTFSCQDAFDEPSTLSLLTDNDSKKWQVIDIDDPSGENSVDCSADDIWIFTLFDETLGQPSYSIEDNFVSCGEEYILEEGFWRLNNQENRITLTSGDTESGNNINTVFTILYIDKDQLELSLAIEDFSGFQLTNVTLTFRAI